MLTSWNVNQFLKKSLWDNLMGQEEKKLKFGTVLRITISALSKIIF